MPLRLVIHTRLVRQLRRTRCAACHRKRVVYSLVADAPFGTGTAETPRLCAECAGITAGDEPLGLDGTMADAEVALADAGS